MTDYKELVERRLAEDHDHMVATGDDLDWLLAQLLEWPKRVHQDRTTNDRFIRASVAATILSLQAERDRLREALEGLFAVVCAAGFEPDEGQPGMLKDGMFDLRMQAARKALSHLQNKGG